MFPSTNYKWKCDVCGEEEFGHHEELDIKMSLLVDSRTCKKCGGKMSGDYLKKGGPQREHPCIHR